MYHQSLQVTSTVGWVSVLASRSIARRGNHYSAVEPPVPDLNDMNAAIMSLELHERGIHVV
jgi:hypothetical protein